MRSIVSLLLVLTLAGGTSGCSRAQRVKAETTAAKILISDEEETRIGLQVKDELEKKEKIRYLNDPTVVGYVNAITNRILPHAKRDRPWVSWQVKVIDDPKTVNAFATPGGFLYVYSGLILAADNEAEVAGVMGHEAGHVVGRHSARQMVNAYGLQTVASLALGKNPGLLSQIAAGLAGQGVLLAHGRSEEIEADEYGARYSSAAGYDPHGIATFFQKLKAKEGKVPAVLTWLSTHPPSGERVDKINRFIAARGLGGSDRGEQRHATIKQQLQRLSANSSGGRR
jgi:predicted Zn-dependent protease